MQSKLVLFSGPRCEYSAYVRSVLRALSLPFTEKVISDETNATELIRRGGKRQTPYFVDESKGVAMYESDDIVEYLKKNYGAETPLTLEKPSTSNVCVPHDFLS
jgi:glutathione S-transferase